MIVMENHHLLWSDKLVFFPDESELRHLVEALALNAFVKVRQTGVEVADHPNLVLRQTMRTSCIPLTKEVDAIYRAMDAKSCRYEIRKAEKMRAQVSVHENDAEAYRDFMTLYNDFVRIKGHDHALSNARYREYLKWSDVYVIYFDNRPLCGHLLLRDYSVKRVRLTLSASARLNCSEDAALVSPLNRYLHWHEIQEYTSKGMEIYDFGGIWPGSSGVKFKLSFGGDMVDEYGYIFAGAFGAGLYLAMLNSYLRFQKKRVMLRMSVKQKLRDALGNQKKGSDAGKSPGA